MNIIFAFRNPKLLAIVANFTSSKPLLERVEILKLMRRGKTIWSMFNVLSFAVTSAQNRLSLPVSIRYGLQFDFWLAWVFYISFGFWMISCVSQCAEGPALAVPGIRLTANLILLLELRLSKLCGLELLAAANLHLWSRHRESILSKYLRNLIRLAIAWSISSYSKPLHRGYQGESRSWVYSQHCSFRCPYHWLNERLGQ